jgi:aspartate kinase
MMETFDTLAESSEMASPARPRGTNERPIVVIKFGDSALGTLGQIYRAAIQIGEQSRRGLLPLIVTSSADESTSPLLRDLRFACRQKGELGASAEREVDRGLAKGETLTAVLLAAAITLTGMRADSVSAREAILLATGPHGAATLTQLRPGKIGQLLKKEIVPVIAGFQAVRQDGKLVALGTDSSDTTAVLIASELQASGYHIVTDGIVRSVHAPMFS